MKVKEIIKELEKRDPESYVFIDEARKSTKQIVDIRKKGSIVSIKIEEIGSVMPSWMKL